MSTNARTKMLWSIPVVVLASVTASWLAVRALAASPVPPSAAGIIAVADTEVSDPALRATIGRFADLARTQRASAP